MYRIAVCEDEAALRAQLTNLCREILTRMEVVHTVCPFASAQELQGAMNEGEQFDLLCLDILLPGQNGMEFAKELRLHDDRISILFVTSSTEFLQEGYSVRPIQYLLKPVREEALAQALRTDLRLHHRPQTVVLQVGQVTSVLTLSDILYIEGRNHGCFVFTTQGEQYFRINLEQIEQKFPRDQFCRCHRSYVVNLRRVRDMNSRELNLDGGKWIPVGRTYLTQFRQQFNDFLNNGNI